MCDKTYHTHNHNPKLKINYFKIPLNYFIEIRSLIHSFVRIERKISLLLLIFKKKKLRIPVAVFDDVPKFFRTANDFSDKKLYTNDEMILIIHS